MAGQTHTHKEGESSSCAASLKVSKSGEERHSLSQDLTWNFGTNRTIVLSV
jgi:hypothetical protein